MRRGLALGGGNIEALDPSSLDGIEGSELLGRISKTKGVFRGKTWGSMASLGSSMDLER